MGASLIVKRVWKYVVPALLVIVALLTIGGRHALANHRNNGSGTCWASGAAWSSHSASFHMDSSIPANWRSAIQAGATPWNNATPSPFTLYNSPTPNNNVIRHAYLGTDDIALSQVYASPTTISKVVMTFDSDDSFTVGGSSTSYDVQNIATHEFGHYYMLWDINTGGCEAVTMWETSVHGETSKRSLETQDRNGANWQYP